MNRVEFVSLEDDHDLIVSFAIAPAAHRSLTLLRSPQYEFLLPKHERGISVSFGPSADERDLLLLVQWRESGVVIKTERHEYRLDLTAVEDEEVAAAKVLLRKMVNDGVARVEEA